MRRKVARLGLAARCRQAYRYTQGQARVWYYPSATYICALPARAPLFSVHATVLLVLLEGSSLKICTKSECAVRHGDTRQCRRAVHCQRRSAPSAQTCSAGTMIISLPVVGFNWQYRTRSRRQLAAPTVGPCVRRVVHATGMHFLLASPLQSVIDTTRSCAAALPAVAPAVAAAAPSVEATLTNFVLINSILIFKLTICRQHRRRMPLPPPAAAPPPGVAAPAARGRWSRRR